MIIRDEEDEFAVVKQILVSKELCLSHAGIFLYWNKSKFQMLNQPSAMSGWFINSRRSWERKNAISNFQQNSVNISVKLFSFYDDMLVHRSYLYSSCYRLNTNEISSNIIIKKRWNEEQAHMVVYGNVIPIICLNIYWTPKWIYQLICIYPDICLT